MPFFSLTTITNHLCSTFSNVPVGVWLIYWIQEFSIPTACTIQSIRMLIGLTSGLNEILNYWADTGTRTLIAGINHSYIATQIYTNLVATNNFYCSVTVQFSAGSISTLPNATSGLTCKLVRLA